MTLHFDKYQGTGNDFIMLDNTNGQHDKLSIPQVQELCQRKFGIGADGLILLQKHPSLDFEMIYYNADGSQSFCGNGARCAVAFAGKLGLLNSPHTHFQAIDGMHEAWLCEHEVRLKMSEVAPIEKLENAYVVQTGSPHYILIDANHSSEHVVEVGKAVRYSAGYQKEGINVNLVEVLEDKIRVATYERGVEDETLSCGTGVTAAALVYGQLRQIPIGKVNILTKGGPLMVEWQMQTDRSFTAVYLTGPAEYVYNGKYELRG
ncbi:MAG: diaminopimelate epimerase [Sphingomonadales bacterium]